MNAKLSTCRKTLTVLQKFCQNCIKFLKVFGTVQVCNGYGYHFAKCIVHKMVHSKHLPHCLFYKCNVSKIKNLFIRHHTHIK